MNDSLRSIQNVKLMGLFIRTAILDTDFKLIGFLSS